MSNYTIKGRRALTSSHDSFANDAECRNITNFPFNSAYDILRNFSYIKTTWLRFWPAQIHNNLYKMCKSFLHQVHFEYSIPTWFIHAVFVETNVVEPMMRVRSFSRKSVYSRIGYYMVCSAQSLILALQLHTSLESSSHLLLGHLWLHF